jgi:hypothetical protein
MGAQQLFEAVDQERGKPDVADRGFRFRWSEPAFPTDLVQGADGARDVDASLIEMKVGRVRAANSPNRMPV